MTQIDTNEGKKYDTGKTKIAMVLGYFSPAVEFLGIVGTYGSVKYGGDAYWDYNWKEVKYAKERYADAAMRHFNSYLGGEWLDKESGLPHLAHAAWNIMALLTLELSERVVK